MPISFDWVTSSSWHQLLTSTNRIPITLPARGLKISNFISRWGETSNFPPQREETSNFRARGGKCLSRTFQLKITEKKLAKNGACSNPFRHIEAKNLADFHLTKMFRSNLQKMWIILKINSLCQIPERSFKSKFFVLYQNVFTTEHQQSGCL